MVSIFLLLVQVWFSKFDKRSNQLKMFRQTLGLMVGNQYF